MAETEKEPTGQDRSTQAGKKAAADNKTAADDNAATVGPSSETKPVADLLISILNDVQQQVQDKAALAAPTATVAELEGEALEAVTQFREIVAALALGPTVTLTATEITDPNNPITFTLTWSSTFADTVSISRNVGPDVGVVEPAAGGSRQVTITIIDQLTVFTATATGRCGIATAEAPALFDVIG